jgi:crotonobetainyl-CoA:carnitine CoA-transferase CaiB-like acyl-CoA transferase
VGVLAGIKVLHIDRLLPASCCTRLLSDTGAEVIMLEYPEGGVPMGLRPSFFCRNDIYHAKYILEYIAGMLFCLGYDKAEITP